MQNSFNTILLLISEQLDQIYNNRQVSTNIAWHILEAITKKQRTEFFTTNYSLTHQEREALHALLNKHIKDHVPLQYLLGTVSFCGLELCIEPPTLIPRPETEEWVHEFIHHVKNSQKDKNIKILDLCTGSGCIALAVGYALSNATIVGIDNAPQAVALAQKNLKKLALNNVNFVLSDLYQELTAQQTFDFIIANPPYISLEEWQSLEPRVKQWEDPAALYSKDNGLQCITAILNNARTYLKPAKSPAPRIFIEIGYNQGQAVRALAKNLGYTAYQIKKDISGNDRVLIIDV